MALRIRSLSLQLTVHEDVEEPTCWKWITEPLPTAGPAGPCGPEAPAVLQDLAAPEDLVRPFRQIRDFDHTLQVSGSIGITAKPLDDAAPDPPEGE
jgi:hypothetical protein